MPSTRQPEKNLKIVKNLYKMKLRNVAVSCVYCKHLHTSAQEINRLNSIVHKSCVWWGKDNLEGNYIDTTLWKWNERDIIICESCSDCLGGVVRRYLNQHLYEVCYRQVSKKLL